MLLHLLLILLLMLLWRQQRRDSLRRHTHRQGGPVQYVAGCNCCRSTTWSAQGRTCDTGITSCITSHSAPEICLHALIAAHYYCGFMT